MMFKKYILNHNAIQLSNKITLNMSENVLDLNRDLNISDLNRRDKCLSVCKSTVFNVARILQSNVNK